MANDRVPVHAAGGWLWKKMSAWSIQEVVVRFNKEVIEKGDEHAFRDIVFKDKKLEDGGPSGWATYKLINPSRD